MRAFAVALTPLMFSLPLFAQGLVHKMVGHWTYLPEKAIPPDPNLKAADITFEKLGSYKLREVSEQTDGSGTKKSLVMVVFCDGEESHNEGSPEGATWICDPETYNFVVKMNGKPGMEVKTDFSVDGRTVTYHRKRLVNGKWNEDTRVWEKRL